MKATLYTLPGSPNALIARLMLEHKGIAYRRVELIQGVHRLIIRLLGFPAGTVPALTIDGRRVQGSCNVSRALDELVPDPPLFPSDPDRRQAVEDAERWGEQTVQCLLRGFGVWMILRAPAAGTSFIDRGPLHHLPAPVAGALAVPFLRVQVRLNRTGDAAAHAALAEFGGVLERVDELVRAGVLGGEELTAADFQIAAHVRMLMCFDDFRHHVEGRPAGALALRVCPVLPGCVPSLLTETERALVASGDTTARSRH